MAHNKMSGFPPIEHQFIMILFLQTHLIILEYYTYNIDKLRQAMYLLRVQQNLCIEALLASQK
jgi:hypothetical protein